jgi:hypothetical protein
MANITEEKWIEMLEKKADGTYIAKYPKVKSKSGITFDEHLAESAIHKTSDVIRTETNTQLKVEVVSSSGSETPEQGRIIFDMSQGKFFGGNGSGWV